MYSVIWGGGAVFLRISKHKEGKTDSRTCISKKYVGLNLDYLFGVKSIFTSHNLPSFFFGSVPREAPRHLKCDVLNSTAIRVRWSAPLQSQGGRIRGYVVFYTKVDDLGKELIPPEQTQVKFTASEHQLVSKKKNYL